MDGDFTVHHSFVGKMWRLTFQNQIIMRDIKCIHDGTIEQFKEIIFEFFTPGLQVIVCSVISYYIDQYI